MVPERYQYAKNSNLKLQDDLTFAPLWGLAGFLETKLSALFGAGITLEKSFYLELGTQIWVE